MEASRRARWVGWSPVTVTLLVSVLSIGAPVVPTLAQTHEVVRVTGPETVRAGEVSVAIDPVQPEHVLAVSLGRGPEGGPNVTNFAYVSRDGGHSWRMVSAPNPGGRTQGDDAITFDAWGVAFHSYISFQGLEEQRPDRASSGVFVSTSSDGGFTWTAPVPVVDHVNTTIPFEDKPWIVTDAVDGSPYKGDIYLAWTRFDVYGSHDPNDSSQIWFSRSNDGGRSFAMPYRISDSGGDAVDSDSTVEGAVPAIGPKGEVYVVWAGPKGLVFDRSLDGGWTFGRDRVIAQNPGGWDIDIDGFKRHNGMPVTGVDRSEGAYRGSIYVNWIDERNGDPDVFSIYSRDGGESWSQPVRVNDDAVGNGRPQMFTWMAVDPVDGSVNVVFFDRRDTEGTRTGVTVARSTDGGRTFVNYRVNQKPFEPNAALFFGDYSGIAAYGGRVVAVYPYFTDQTDLALYAALFHFRPGTQQTLVGAEAR